MAMIPRTRERAGGLRSRLSRAGLASLLLHLIVLAGLLAWFGHAPRAPEPPDQQVAVELVLDKGNAPGVERPPRSIPQPDVPAPPKEATEASEALPEPPVPPPPAPPAPHAEEAPQITIGGNESDSNTIVTSIGPYVLPATIDTKYHNRNPSYPNESARLAQEGAVIMLIHVSAEGLPNGVDIQESSGYPLLDQAAEDAVSSWHFLPAVKDGQAIPYDLPFRIVFRLDRP